MGTGKGQSDGSIWADSHESLNRCFTMAFCFACFIEQRADIHVNLALLQSARSRGEYGALFRFLFDPLSLYLSFLLFLSLFSSMSLSFLRFAFSSFLFLSPPSTRMLLFSSLVLLPSPLFLYLPRFSFPSIFYVSPFFIKLLV